MVGVAVAIIVWLRSSQESASARRMRRMMARIGLAPGTATLADPRSMAMRKDARRRCRKCPREDLCERWLAGEVGGSNSFCPNARIFRFLRRLSAPAA
jgi:hypothetical protein